MADFRIRLALAAALSAAALGVRAAEETVSDTEKWNVGVDAYRAGDAAQALAVMRPLMKDSKEYAVRAAEVVAKLEYDAAHDLSNTNTLVHLERAAAAAQKALSASPDDRRANDNFTRATDGLKELRETTRVNGLIEAAQGKDPSASVKSAMDDARALLAQEEKSAGAGAAEKISAADAAEAKARKIADVWIPLKDFIQKNVTNETEAAATSKRIDEARALTLEAAKRLGDMDTRAGDALAASEDALSAFHKALVLPPEAIGECLLSQSNAWTGARQETLRTWNEDALAYTKAFRSKFDQWADMYAMQAQAQAQAQASTNMVPLTAETREKIKSLAERLESEQTDASADPTKEKNAKALDTVREIIALMPVPPPQQNQQNQQQKDQQKKQDQNQENKDQDGNDNEDQQQGQQDQQKDEEKQSEEKESEEKSPEEKEDEALLRLIREKSAEHEDAKRKMIGEGRSRRDW